MSLKIKDFLEKKIVKAIQESILTDKLISDIAQQVTAKFNAYIGQNELLEEFRRKQNENDRSINNLLSAMEQGIITNSTKTRLEQLEKRKEEIEHNIAVQISIKREPISIFEITRYLHTFKNLDCNIESNKKRLLHLFVRKAILYDDKCHIYFNFTDRAEALLTLEDSLSKRKENIEHLFTDNENIEHSEVNKNSKMPTNKNTILEPNDRVFKYRACGAKDGT